MGLGWGKDLDLGSRYLVRRSVEALGVGLAVSMFQRALQLLWVRLKHEFDVGHARVRKVILYMRKNDVIHVNRSRQQKLEMVSKNDPSDTNRNFLSKTCNTTIIK